MNKKLFKVKYPKGSGWKDVMDFMTALRIDNTMLKHCFIMVMAFQLAAFFVVLPSCGSSDEPGETEEDQVVAYRMNAPKENAPGKHTSKPRRKTEETRDLKNQLSQLGYVDGAAGAPAPPADESFVSEKEFNTEEYAKLTENDFLKTMENPLSTFSIDVDTASYSNVRRFLSYGDMPTVDAVRVEEMINYFNYNYPEPTGKHPFNIITEVASCPWADKHKLVRIGIQGKRIKSEEKPQSNLVFLLDVSGSMSDSNKLPLLKRAFGVLTENLDEDDKVSIVVYAGAAGTVLEPTDGDEKDDILNALNSLDAGGSTHGAEGIELAYKLAEENLIEDGNNRIILATDGDFNVGISSTSDLTRMIEKKREKGIYLTILGFGMGNYKDSRMEQMADQGNGNYYYIDNYSEAKKVLGSGLTGTLFTIAKDVKIQVEFNPAKVQAYRLIGYENRMLAKEDFNDDKKDAGELGAGHNVTALYEIVPVGVKMDGPHVDKLEFQQTKIKKEAYASDVIMKVKFRYKPPKADKSILIVHGIKDASKTIENASESFRFAAAVAAFGMMLRDSEYKGDFTYNKILKLALDSKGDDENGYRREFIQMVETAKKLDKKQR